MKNLIKKIGMGLAGISLLGLVSCATLPKKAEENPMGFYLNMETYSLELDYDTDGDGRGDLRKVYKVTNVDMYGNFYVEYRGYYKDLNNNGIYEKEEFFSFEKNNHQNNHNQNINHKYVA